MKKIVSFFDFIAIESKLCVSFLLILQLIIPLVYNKNFGLHDFFVSVLKIWNPLYIFSHSRGVQIFAVLIVFALLVYRVIRKDYFFEKENKNKIDKIKQEDFQLKENNKSLEKENELVKDLLDHIEIIVTEKSQRFSNTAAKVLNGESLSSGAIFQEITQPMSQMQCIITNLKNYLSKQCNDNTIVSYLFDVKHDRIGQMKLRNHKDNLDLNCILNNDDIQKSITERNIVVVEKVDNHDNRHSFSKQGMHEIVSAVCYPVLEGNGLDFILLICSEKYQFKKENEDIYKLVFEMFCSRIKLEMHLSNCLEKRNDK